MIRTLKGNQWQCKEWLLKEPSLLSKQTASIYLHKFAEMKCSKGFSNQQISMTFAIHFVTSGKGYFKTKSKNYPVKKGDIFFFFPQEYYQYAAINHHWNFNWVNLGGKDLVNILLALKINTDHPFISNANTDLLSPIMSACRKSLGYTTPLQSSSISLAWSMVEYLEKINVTNQTHLDVAEQTKWLIDNDSYNSLTVQELADQLEYTRATIYRLFKNKYQISPKDYIDKVKIEKAIMMLVTTNSPIKEISSSLGFTNPNYFARTFRKHTSLNPKEYRKKHQN